MNKEVVTVIFHITQKNFQKDIEIPLYISANDLVIALNEAYQLEIDTTDVKKCYLKSEQPIALLKGNKTLEEFGIRNGTHIYFTD